MESFVTISETAINQINSILKAQTDRKNLFLRLFVQGTSGGISFGMALDERKSDDDHICDYDGLEVAIDRISFPYLDGGYVDYIVDETKDNQGFQVTSPSKLVEMAVGGGCGSCSGEAGCC